MRSLLNLFRVLSQVKNVKTDFTKYLPQRGLKFQTNIKWKYPDRKTFYHPSNTGDLAPFPNINPNLLKLQFQNLDEAELANDKVKKIFCIEYQPSRSALDIYEKELVDKVKRHPLDDSSKEVRIAKLTAKIRFFSPMLGQTPKKSKLIIWVKEMIDARLKCLKELRKMDYKKFEWLLDKLELEYKPPVVGCRTITRKTSLVLLAKLQVEKAKEEKLAELKKSFDEQKVPFLEKKLEKLKWIKEMEEKHNLVPSVSDEDIQKCIQRIKLVKAEVSEKMRRGYIRKIHPYFLEPYDEVLLKEKEKLQKPLYYEEYFNEEQGKSK